MNRRVKLIFNPHADRGRAWNIASPLQSIVERYGNTEWSATEYPGHATELAEQAAEEGFGIVASIGGDGTTHEVVNGLMRIPEADRPLLACVPVGSGNDFSANVGVVQEPEKAMHRVFTGDIKTIDMMIVKDNTGHTEYIDNTMGIQFGAFATLHSHSITRLQGFAMYLWAVIKTIILNHDAPHVTIETDQETLAHHIQYLVICNGPREGGGFFVAPDAIPDDGILDYAMIQRVSRLMMFRIVPEVMNGTHGKFKKVKLGQFHHLKLVSERPLAIHTDGEILAGFTSEITELEVNILPKALKIIV
ncbi:MAG TPA: YegS/Rv2252/BmrU family lipid kinase [Anaerolineae bacterium]|nr:YegS/Rv2252/BmrU family lipid kinase [Anaerolineae bacterium]